jgi:hypothetical protein
MKKQKIISGRIQSPTRVEIKLARPLQKIDADDFNIEPSIAIKNIQALDSTSLLLTTAPLDVRQNYRLKTTTFGSKTLLHDEILDQFYSEKPLGCQRDGERWAFRLFAPRALQVKLLLFDRHDDLTGREFPMQRDNDGVWEFFAAENVAAKFYGYRLSGPSGDEEYFDDSKIVADPYSRAVATRNHYRHREGH